MQSTLPSNNQPKSLKGTIRTLIVAVLLLAITLFVTLNRQYVLDVAHFWTYQPTSTISAITERAAFNETGKFTFYATRPTIEGSQVFNERCDRKEEGTAILGCYANDRIYIYDVNDERLDGIKEVTAAHEMLHAAYLRMSEEERKKVNSLVEEEYKKLSSDPVFSSRMEFYARTEPGERDNELHSIIGTEVGNINQELEAHYAQYFTDRSKVVSLYNGYNEVFSQLDREAKRLEKQLNDLASRIESDSVKYNNSIKDINDEIIDFNRRASRGEFSSQAAFDSERSALQQEVASINELRESINKRIAQYETLRKRYNDTVTQSNNLYKSIDSSLAPAPSI